MHLLIYTTDTVDSAFKIGNLSCEVDRLSLYSLSATILEVVISHQSFVLKLVSFTVQWQGARLTSARLTEVPDWQWCQTDSGAKLTAVPDCGSGLHTCCIVPCRSTLSNGHTHPVFGGQGEGGRPASLSSVTVKCDATGWKQEAEKKKAVHHSLTLPGNSHCGRN